MPIKGIVLEAGREDVKFTDQAIDLVPGDPQTIRVFNLNRGQVKLRHLGHSDCLPVIKDQGAD